MINSFYASISKFVEMISAKYNDTEKCFVYFENDNAFKNEYDKVCTKPIFILLITKDNQNTIIQHKDIFTLFDGELILTFNENNRRKIDLDKKGILYMLQISFDPKDFNGNVYYNSILREVTNEKNIKKIKKQITTYEYQEQEIPDFEI